MLHDPHFTAQEFTQVQLTYTLSAVTVLLGLATLWLACGTLARDIEECQMQVVATKPIARWQIWLGKWMGLLSLNAALLAIAGTCIYGQLIYQARKLNPAQQAVLRNEVLVARGVAREKSYADEIEAETTRVLQERLAQTRVAQVDVKEVRNQIREQIKAEIQVVPPGTYRLRVAALESSGRGGTADHSIEATLTSIGPISASSVMIGLSREGGFVPAMEFSSEPTAFAMLELYGAVSPAPRAVFEIATTTNDVVDSTGAAIDRATDGDDRT